jgi:DNA repair exonuclease SbcCD nuclease subunit
MTANFDKEKASERKTELLHTFQRMIQYASENGVEAVIIAGDLFDTKVVSAVARNTVYQAVINHPEMTFYYLKGNHDADSFLDHLEEIPDNLKLFDTVWKSYTANEKTAGNICITGVELNADNSGTVYHTLTLDTDKFNIVVLHGQESNSAAKDHTEEISLKELKNKGIDYLALGHIHSYKKETLDARGVYCYPGCMEGRGFDECGEHGFVLLDIDEQKHTMKTEFIPIAYRNLYTVPVDISGCANTSEIAQRIHRVLEKEDIFAKHLLKIVLEGCVDVECEKDTQLLAKQFENDYYFLKIYDESRLKVDYSIFMQDESLKGEFIRTVMNQSDLSEEEKAVIVRYGMQALAGEEIR